MLKKKTEARVHPPSVNSSPRPALLHISSTTSLGGGVARLCDWARTSVPVMTVSPRIKARTAVDRRLPAGSPHTRAERIGGKADTRKNDKIANKCFLSRNDFDIRISDDLVLLRSWRLTWGNRDRGKVCVGLSDGLSHGHVLVHQVA
jgi:hypothetical protein